MITRQGDSKGRVIRELDGINRTFVLLNVRKRYPIYTAGGIMSETNGTVVSIHIGIADQHPDIARGPKQRRQGPSFAGEKRPGKHADSIANEDTNDLLLRSYCNADFVLFNAVVLNNNLLYAGGRLFFVNVL
jgi:hypothetical protein